MGKYYKGILGAISGLVGTVVGATWNGVEVMRSRPKKSTKPPTAAQIEVQDTFTLMTDFLGGVRDVLKTGFQAYHKGQMPYNAAFKLNIEQAIAGVYPALTITYASVVISKGGLLESPDIAMATTEDAQLDFSWVNNADVDEPFNTDSTDKVTFVAYNPVKQNFVKRRSAALRSAASYDMAVPVSWSGDMVHVWAFFVRADGKKVSDSVYVGTTAVQ